MAKIGVIFMVVVALMAGLVKASERGTIPICLDGQSDSTVLAANDGGTISEDGRQYGVSVAGMGIASQFRLTSQFTDALYLINRITVVAAVPPRYDGRANKIEIWSATTCENDNGGPNQKLYDFGSFTPISNDFIKYQVDADSDQYVVLNSDTCYYVVVQFVGSVTYIGMTNSTSSIVTSGDGEIVSSGVGHLYVPPGRSNELEGWVTMPFPGAVYFNIQGCEADETTVQEQPPPGDGDGDGDGSSSSAAASLFSFNLLWQTLLN